MIKGVDGVAATSAEWRGLLAGIEPPPQIVGCYGNGAYANHTAAKLASPHATFIVYDVNGSMPECDALDIEPRDAVPADAHAWANDWHLVREKRTFARPWLYASASSTSQVISDMLDHGWKRSDFFIQSAHYSHPHICGPTTCQYPKAESTQWIDHGPRGQNLDQTLYEDYVLVAGSGTDPHYERFDNTRRAMLSRHSERDLVQEYDKWRAMQTHRKHPHRLRLYFLRYELGQAARRLQNLGQLDKFDRRWRLRELRDRQAGKRLV